jgi:hypothetical protein
MFVLETTRARFGVVLFNCTKIYKPLSISLLYNSDQLVLPYHERLRHKGKRYRLSCTPDQLSGHVPRNLSYAVYIRHQLIFRATIWLAERDRALEPGCPKLYANPHIVLAFERIDSSQSQVIINTFVQYDLYRYSRTLHRRLD